MAVPVDPLLVFSDIARLQLVCLVRAGDGYVVRAVRRSEGAAQPSRQLDIAFGGAVDRSVSDLELVVRQVQQWCDEGTTVMLFQDGTRLALRARDGVEIALPQAG